MHGRQRIAVVANAGCDRPDAKDIFHLLTTLLLPESCQKTWPANVTIRSAGLLWNDNDVAVAQQNVLLQFSTAGDVAIVKVQDDLTP